MFSYADFDNDRGRVRQRFLREMSMQTSLKDIGELLDKFIVEEKGEQAQYYDPTIHYDKPPRVQVQDTDSYKLHWSEGIMRTFDPVLPSKDLCVICDSSSGQPGSA